MNLPRLLAIAAAVIAIVAGAAFADTRTENIRPLDPVARLLLQLGMERSQTFRQLVRDLRRSNVIVYVEVRRDPRYGHRGFLTFMVEKDGWRWVRATIDSGTTDHATLIANAFHLTEILGHELQHAREVIAARSMGSLDDFAAYFRRIGTVVGKDRFDTAKAVKIGRTVASELRSRDAPLVGDTAVDAWSNSQNHQLVPAQRVRSVDEVFDLIGRENRMLAAPLSGTPTEGGMRGSGPWCTTGGHRFRRADRTRSSAASME
jgi:hypothetical protein